MRTGISEDSLLKLERLKKHLNDMGYVLNSYGEAVVLPFIKAGMDTAEAASRIALASMARDVQNAGGNCQLLEALEQHASEIIYKLHELKLRGLIQESIWRSDANAILRVSTPDTSQSEWVAYILGNRALDKYRMAINCNEFVLAKINSELNGRFNNFS